jgi:bifunctional DNase/RNase
VMSLSNGKYTLFIGTENKTLMIHVEPSIGMSIQHVMSGNQSERPLTHELIDHILRGVEAKLERVVINDVRNSTFYARIILHMKNELGEKWIEIDARPSDSIVLALQSGCPILMARNVLDAAQDVTDLLNKIIGQEN